MLVALSHIIASWGSWQSEPDRPPTTTIATTSSTTRLPTSAAPAIFKRQTTTIKTDCHITVLPLPWVVSSVFERLLHRVPESLHKSWKRICLSIEQSVGMVRACWRDWKNQKQQILHIFKYTLTSPFLSTRDLLLHEVHRGSNWHYNGSRTCAGLRHF